MGWERGTKQLNLSFFIYLFVTVIIFLTTRHIHREGAGDQQFLSVVNSQWTDHCRQMVRRGERGGREGEGREGKEGAFMWWCFLIDYDSEHIPVSGSYLCYDHFLCILNMVSL